MSKRQPITPSVANSTIPMRGITWYNPPPISGWGGDFPNPMYICEACGNEVEYGDQISVQMGKDNAVYFHKSCYIDPDNQSMIRSLVVAEDVIGI